MRLIAIKGGLTSTGWQGLAEIRSRYKAILFNIVSYSFESIEDVRTIWKNKGSTFQAGSSDERISEQDLEQAVD